MGLFDFFKNIFAGAPARGEPSSERPGLRSIEELANRLGVTVEELRAVQPQYRESTIPKRSGGTRRILAPDPALKTLQRRILKRLLGRLRAHPAVHGFERGHSIVSNAKCHKGRAIVLRMDVENFFESTTTKRVEAYFQFIGWDAQASQELTRLCTHGNGLPQGAPTSPRLSNLVNYDLDRRLEGLARKYRATYTRYADDLTFSFTTDEPSRARVVIRATKAILAKMGYQLHQRKKLSIRRRHAQQLVTGLVVNERINLPRETRRWLRAVEHHIAAGRQATLTPAQLEGWRALRSMIEKQSSGR
jgi:RNA-directed DNA polymerase